MDTEEPEVQPEDQQPVKWQVIVTTISGQLSLSILRGPKNVGDVKWLPDSCGFFIRLSSNWSSSYLSSIKIDKQIMEVFEKANTQIKTKKDEPINEVFVYGQDSVKISKPNAAEDFHVIKNNRYLFSITEKDLQAILWWFKLMNYILWHQDPVVKPENEEAHIEWNETAKSYVEIFAKMVVLEPHQDGFCECSPLDACQPPTCSLVIRKRQLVSPFDEQRYRHFNALFEGTPAVPLEQSMKASRKEEFRKQLNQAVDIINKACNWKIDMFDADYDPVRHQWDWHLEDRPLSTIISEVLRQDKNMLKAFQFYLKKDL